MADTEQTAPEDVLDKLRGGWEFKDMQVRRMKLMELRPAEYNPRRISPKAFTALGASIEKFGIMVPIVWNKRTGNIVGGHQRFRHLVEEGTEETDVVVVDLDSQEEAMLNITLNNKELRGQFTEDAVRLLKMTEAQIGSVFGDMALVDLHDALVKRLKKPVSTAKSDDVPPGGLDGEEPVAVITCPKCRSRWEMNSKKIVYSAVRDADAAGVEKKNE